MTANPQVITRTRIVMSAKLAGKAADVDMRSCLRFIHSTRVPLPVFADRAECRISFQMDRAVQDVRKKDSTSEEIYKGFLFFSKGGLRKEPGFYLPLEVMEFLTPKINKRIIDLEDEGWNVSDMKKAFVKNVFNRGTTAFSVPVSADLFIEGKAKTLKVDKIIFEYWMMRMND